jgi:hypothetical protein
LPSTDDQITYITGVVTRGWTSPNEKAAQATIINQLPNMGDGEVRDIYKYFKNYYNGNFIITYQDDIPTDDINNIQSIYSNYGINHN